MARPRGDIDVRVVRAAHARFLSEGVDGASLRAIARDAETSVGMVYYYFPTKDDLFAAVVEDVYASFLDDLTRIIEPRAPLPERLARLYARLGEATRREREVLRIVLREALVSSTRLDRVIQRFQRGHLPLLLGALGEGVAEGEVDPELPIPLALIFTVAVGFAAQIMSREVAPRLHFAVAPEGEALARLLADRVMHGIQPRGAAPPTTPPRARDTQSPSPERPVRRSPRKAR